MSDKSDKSDKNIPSNEYVAIYDIGSNAVRLVVFDGFNRAPVRIHNERNVCGLGADLATTGLLNPEGVRRALDSLRRYAGLVAAMKIGNIRAVATAAVRDARDGKDFIARVQKEFGIPVSVIDGEEEARLSALGVMANGLGKDGIIGDYGGGSLELIVVDKGEVRHKASLPLGSHRLHAVEGRAARIKVIDEYLASTEFLKKFSGRDFYAMGGAWRSMAKAHMHMARHPLMVLDHYQIGGAKAVEFAELMARQSLPALERTVGLSKKRIKDMAVAALVMERLFETIKPRRLIFSATGLREGLIFDRLSPPVQKQDALITSCAKIAQKISRFDDLRAFHQLALWMAPLFKGEDRDTLRLIEASCLLSDTGWFEHEDYQADHAFDRVLVMPLYAVDHPGRAFLALSQYVRYKGYLRRSPGREGYEVTRTAQKLLSDEDIELAVRVGLAQRMGYLLTGGALGLLKHTAFKVTPKTLSLEFDDDAGMLSAHVIEDALAVLAEKMGRGAG